MLNHDPISLLLSRLQNVRQFGTGYRADCPIGHSSRGALSVGQTDSGGALVHCFAGCGARDVLSAISLTLADLYPSRMPEAHIVTRKAMESANWRAALGVLARESVIVLAAAQAVRDDVLTPEDKERLGLAVERIQSARVVLT